MAATVGAVRSKSRTRFSFHVGVAKGGVGSQNPLKARKNHFHTDTKIVGSTMPYLTDRLTRTFSGQ